MLQRSGRLFLTMLFGAEYDELEAELCDAIENASVTRPLLAPLRRALRDGSGSMTTFARAAAKGLRATEGSP